MTKSSRPWILGTIAFCLVLVLMAWFLVISPKRAEAEQTRDDTATLAVTNNILAAKVEKLAGQFARLDEFKADLAGLQVRIPLDVETSKLLRDLTSVADDADVVLTELSSAVGAQVPIAEAPAPEPEPEGEAEGEDEDEAPDAGGSEAAAVPGGEGLVAFPLNLTFYGSYDNANTFINMVQTKLPRYALISTLQIEAMEEAEADDSGTPDLEPGDVKFIASGYIYVLPSDSFEAGTDPDSDEDVTLPKPKSGKNLFQKELQKEASPED